jgi:hypothetical protein
VKEDPEPFKDLDAENLPRIDVEALTKLARETKAHGERATPGPWLQATHVGEPRALVAQHDMRASLLALDRDGMAIVGTVLDAVAIAHARTAAPALADAVLALLDCMQRVARWNLLYPVGTKVRVRRLVDGHVEGTAETTSAAWVDPQHGWAMIRISDNGALVLVDCLEPIEEETRR